MRPKTKTKPRQDARSRASRKGRSHASRRVDLDDDALLDLVHIAETSFLLAGLLCARQYFDREDGNESQLRARINWLWEGVHFQS
jgi:hypothetical protein